VTDNKAPAYPWYPRDFAADEPVQLMSLSEEGAYRRLLDHQWLHGSVPGDIPSLARICKNVPVKEMRKMWPALEGCFTRMEGQPPRLQNRRLERVRQERKAYLDKQVESGKRGAAARWRDKGSHGEPIGEPMASLMANECLASAIASASAIAEEKPSSPTETGEARQQGYSGVTRGELLGSLRKLCAPRSGRIGDAAMRTNASCVDTLAGRRWSYADIHAAVAGTRTLIDRGAIPSIPPGTEWTLRVLTDADPTVDPMQRGIDAYRANPPPTRAELKERGGTEGIAEVLDFSKFAKEA
jgi:uncharacterized protein YdaU (DUF1376 family)